MNIIGDIAGEFETFLKLKSKMPKDNFILAGDIVDRGPDSCSMVQYCIDNEDTNLILGNHEDMMIDFYYQMNRYSRGTWMMNGGSATLKSYGLKRSNNSRWARNAKVLNHVDYLLRQPWVVDFTEPTDGTRYIVSHAPIKETNELESTIKETIHMFNFGLLWNRSDKIIDMPGVCNIFGHNSFWGLQQFKRKDGTNHAICLDTSGTKVLTGYSTKTKQFYQVPFVG